MNAVIRVFGLALTCACAGPRAKSAAVSDALPIDHPDVHLIDGDFHIHGLVSHR